MTRNLVAGFAAAATLFGAAAAHAVPVVSFDFTLPTPDGPVATPTSTTGIVRLNFVGTDASGGDVFDPTPPNSRSPWDNTVFENDPLAQYNSVSAGATATYDFARDQRSFSLMWGSPDSYNTLSFLLDGQLVFALSGTNVANPPTPGTGFVNTTITNFLFDQVIFSSANDAFEYARLATSAVPVPPAALALISALAGLGFVGRKRSAAKA